MCERERAKKSIPNRRKRFFLNFQTAFKLDYYPNMEIYDIGPTDELWDSDLDPVSRLSVNCKTDHLNFSIFIHLFPLNGQNHTLSGSTIELKCRICEIVDTRPHESIKNYSIKTGNARRRKFSIAL